MFDSITFYSNTYFVNSVTPVYFSQHPLSIYYAARYVHFTVSLGTRSVLFFLRGQMASHSPKRFVCLVNTIKKTTARKTTKSLEVKHKFYFALNNFMVSWYVFKFTKINFHVIFFIFLPVKINSRQTYQNSSV